MPVRIDTFVADAATAIARRGSASRRARGADSKRPTLDQSKLVPDVAGVATGASRVVLTTVEPWPRWCRVSRGPTLDRLARDTLAGKRDLGGALARVPNARRLVRESFAPLRPQISTVGAAGDVTIPPNATATSESAGASAAAAFSGHLFQTRAGVGTVATLTWERALRGRARRSLESRV